jgi:outer membrane protein
MNKIKLFMLAVVVFISADSVMAQKSGYISVDQIVSIMPETGKIDSLLRKYQSDSLAPRYAYMVQEYNRKDSIANGKDSAKTPASVRVKVREELEQLLYELQNWQQISQQYLQAKQQQLLEPIYIKVDNAIKAVAKENGYAYVFNREALLVMPPADDLLQLVAKKLNVKVPAAATASTGAAPAR